LSLDWLNPEDTRRVTAYLQERCGIPAGALAGLRLFRRGGYVCALREEAAEVADLLQVAGGGLRLVKEMGPGRYKPATRGMQVLATRVETGIDLSEAELRGLLQGQTLSTSLPGRGFVLLRWEGAVVGVGLLREGRLVGQLPRTVTEHLRLGGDRPLV